MTLPAAFETYKESLDATLRSAFDGRDLGIYQMQRYHLGWIDAKGRPSNGQGKGLRPMMCLFACQAAGGDWRKALNAAAAMELVHNFSLIHDDIQDGDTQRRHRDTVWHKWGLAQGINAGDSMRGLAALTLGQRCGLLSVRHPNPPCGRGVGVCILGHDRGSVPGHYLRA